jgi:hypothetical protein
MSKTVSYDGFIHIVKATLPLVKERKITLEEFGRCAMLAFGDIGSVHSGLISSDIIRTHNPTGRMWRGSEVTHEHFKTRTVTCREICQEYLDGNLTDERLIELIEEGRKVHYVTKQENIDLCVHQQNKDLTTWQEQYEACGIKLVKDVELFGNKTYWYRVDGIAYADKHEAAAAHSCGSSTVVNRSRNKKFPNWKEYKYTSEQFK